MSLNLAMLIHIRSCWTALANNEHATDAEKQLCTARASSVDRLLNDCSVDAFDDAPLGKLTIETA
jgi:hypothetical protein